MRPRLANRRRGGVRTKTGGVASVALQGGPPSAELIASSRSGSGASPHTVMALVCALAGYLTETSLRPPPPGLPAIRAFQPAYATIARHWLTECL